MPVSAHKCLRGLQRTKKNNKEPKPHSHRERTSNQTADEACSTQAFFFPSTTQEARDIYEESIKAKWHIIGLWSRAKWRVLGPKPHITVQLLGCFQIPPGVQNLGHFSDEGSTKCYKIISPSNIRTLYSKQHDEKLKTQNRRLKQFQNSFVYDHSVRSNTITLERFNITTKNKLKI